MAIRKRHQAADFDSEEEELDYSSQEELEQSNNDLDSDQEDDDDDEDEDEDEEEDDDEEESEDEQETKAIQLAKIKRDLAHVSFEQLAELKGKMGMKEFSNDKVDQKKKKSTTTVSKEQILKDLKGAVGKLKKTNKVKRTKEDMKRESKHKPMEISSKRAVGRYRDVVQLQAEKRRDPRFDKLSGQLNQDLFEKSYNFLNDYKKSEIDMLKDRIKKEQDPDEQDRIKGLLLKMTSAEKMEQEKKRKQALLRDRKKQESELVKQGKTPYFLKKSEKRKLDLMDRYEKLGAKSVDRILEKRRKRNTTKDRKHLPFNRRSQATE